MRHSFYQKSRAVRLAATLLTVVTISPAWAQQGDVTKGGELFATHCAECHSMKEGKDKKGPSLFSIFDNKAALRENYVYSDALRNSHITWNAESLGAYLTNPKKLVPGGKMKYDGLESASERADLIAYLARQSKH